MNKQKFFNDVIIIDVESTDVDPRTSEIVELASGIYDNNQLILDEELFNSEVPISFKASAINNISQNMIANLPTTTEGWDRVKEIFRYGNNKYIVAHNSQYDSYVVNNAYIKAVETYGEEAELANITNDKWICTLRIARHILPKEYPDISFKLTELRYYFDLDVPDDIVLHRACADVALTGKLLELLVDEAIRLGFVEDSDTLGEDLYELCWTPINIEKMPFGKHRGELLSDVPNSYLIWLVDNHEAFDSDSFNFDNDLYVSVKNEMENRLE